MIDSVKYKSIYKKIKYKRASKTQYFIIAFLWVLLIFLLSFIIYNDIGINVS